MDGIARCCEVCLHLLRASEARNTNEFAFVVEGYEVSMGASPQRTTGSYSDERKGAQSSGTGAKLDIFLSFMPYFMNRNGAGKASAATAPNILIAGPVTRDRQ